MRRTIALLTTMAMTLLLATSVAIAVEKTCPYSGDCKGTNYVDRLHGGEGSNNIYGYKGNDVMFGRDGNDRMYGASGDDVMFGDSDYDNLYGSTGKDRMYGGDDSDFYNGYGNDDVMVDLANKYSNNDIYSGFFYLPILLPGSESSGDDQVSDYGGTADELWFE